MTAWRRSTPPDAFSAGASAPAWPTDRSAAAPPKPLSRTPPGRVFLVSGALLVAAWLIQLGVTLPDALELLRKLISLTFLVSGIWLLVLVVVRNRGAFLWRVRRRLILSYVFLGVVPIVLVLVFAMAGNVVLYENLSAYLFRQGLDDVVEDVQTIARNVAAEVSRASSVTPTVIATRYANWSARYPELSLAVVPVGASHERPSTAGPWQHANAPVDVPRWVIDARGFTGITSIGEAVNTQAAQSDWVIRAAAPTADRQRLVIVDLPLGPKVSARVEELTGARILGVGSFASVSGKSSSPFQTSVASLDVRVWRTGAIEQGAISLHAPIRELVNRVAKAQSAQLSSDLLRGWGFLLVLLAVLFAIVQGSALVMGAALARSITYAVHELFVGTERVREGDFSHRIRVESQDQLGSLADSFNRMSGSIEHLLHVQREKQRLDDELRIARDIQQSLLPVRPPAVQGLAIAGLCRPAREVGGDYYDFFDLEPRQLGVLVADVSGKGTSAALYMAELKGLMLALSHTERSPARLLRTVNHLLAEHLDNRSFITATYAVVDLDRMTLTCARAGHTPLIVVSGGRSELIVPDGMVLGLRLPGASERFEALLEEHTRPLSPGDVVVLYTDGITEAMDTDGELFGDAALARVLASGAASQDPAAIRECVVREVDAFVGDAEQHDDMTMVVLRVNAAGEGRLQAAS